MRSAINALKNIGLEIVTQPAMSLKDVMIIHLTKKDGTTEITISEIYKSNTNKECHFLNVSGKTQSYCISKSSILPSKVSPNSPLLANSKLSFPNSDLACSIATIAVPGFTL